MTRPTVSPEVTRGMVARALRPRRRSRGDAVRCPVHPRGRHVWTSRVRIGGEAGRWRTICSWCGRKRP